MSEFRAKGNFTGAQWVKLPVNVDELPDRQQLLYLRLATRAVTGEESHQGERLKSGVTRFVIREWARAKGVSEKSIRRDLHALDLAGLIRVGERAGNAVKVYVLDPRWVPAVEAIERRETPHLERMQIARIILESCRIDESACPSVPHLVPHSNSKKSAENGSKIQIRRGVTAAPGVPLDSRIRKNLLEASHGANAPSPSRSEEDGERAPPPASKKAGLDGPLVSSAGPSGPEGGSQKGGPDGPLKRPGAAGLRDPEEGASGAAGEGWASNPLTQIVAHRIPPGYCAP